MEMRTCSSPELLVICPTLRRPRNVARLRDSYMQTATDVSELRFVNGDDTCTSKVNQAAAVAALDYTALMFVGDDHVFGTPGWDKALLEPLRERPGITYPDTVSRYGHPEVFAISASIVAALGWMMLPSLRHYYVDDVIMQLGGRAGCITFLPEVKVPHLHYLITGEARDSVYERAQGWLDGDRDTYWAWLRDQSDADVETVRKLVKRET